MCVSISSKFEKYQYMYREKHKTHVLTHAGGSRQLESIGVQRSRLCEGESYGGVSAVIVEGK